MPIGLAVTLCALGGGFLTKPSREFPHLYRWRDESATIFSPAGK